MKVDDIESWCYQIIKHVRKDGMTWYGLHEVYKDKQGHMITYTVEPDIVGDSVAEILRAINNMRHDARTKPVICVTDDETTEEPK